MFQLPSEITGPSYGGTRGADSAPRPTGASFQTPSEAPGSEPPNYRDGTCETCINYDVTPDGEGSMCTKYPDATISPGGRCDDFSPALAEDESSMETESDEEAPE